ncbi:hypothetical protein [Actinotalea solisilvae]|uniref:hypothetical protein n=1 Tax=Actinotalea solisilvae TaxID=2072922 RepID=UPI0018F12505|nr:hypothetical protein [Actinotalea solisilvae]
MPQLAAERQWHTYVEGNVHACIDQLTGQGPHTGDAGADVHARAVPRGKHASTPADAKGLELDHVVLLEPAAFLRAYDDEAQAARALHVAHTRATRLTITHRLPLPYGITTDATEAPA